MEEYIEDSGERKDIDSILARLRAAVIVSIPTPEHCAISLNMAIVDCHYGQDQVKVIINILTCYWFDDFVNEDEDVSSAV